MSSLGVPASGKRKLMAAFPAEFRGSVAPGPLSVTSESHVTFHCGLVVSFVSLSLNDVTQLQTPLRSAEISFSQLRNNTEAEI